MNKFKIACDVDDVLGGFYPSLCKRFGKPEQYVNIWDGKSGGECKWISDKFPDLYSETSFWENISRISTPESITFEVDHYITSIPADLHDVREEWLIKNGFPKRPLICTLNSKAETMKALGINVLIDDKPSTIKEVRDAGLIGIQFVPTYMSDYDKNDYFTIKHLSQVKGLLENL